MSHTFAVLAYSNVDVESEDSKKNPLLILRKMFSDLDRTACWTNYDLDSALREVDLKSGLIGLVVVLFHCRAPFEGDNARRQCDRVLLPY